MSCIVVGKRTGSFTDRKTGELIEFGKLYVTYPYDGVDGLASEECKLKPDSIVHVSVGDNVRLERNQYGKVTCVEVV